MPSLTNDDYTIHINTVANTEGATKAERALNNVANETKQVDEKSKSAGGAFGGLVGQFALGNIAANVATNAFSQIKNQLTSTIQLAEAQQNAQAQLNNALKSTGDASGMTIQGLNGIADSTQKTTTYSKLDTEQAEETMLTYTNIGKNVFPQTMTAAENMATRFGIDLPNAAKLLGRALNDPAHGMTALTRYLGTLSPAMQKNIKDMEASGNAAGAQALLIDQLNHKMGGAAATAAQTFSGKMTQLKNKLDDAKIAIGTDMIKAVEKLLPALERIGNKIVQFLEPAFKQLWQAIKQFMPVFERLLPYIKPIAELLGGVLVVAIWLVAEVLRVLITIITDVIKWLEKHRVVMLLVIGVMLLAISPIILIGLAIMELIKHWKEISKTVEKVWHDITGFITGLWHDVVSIFDNIWKAISGSIGNVVKTVQQLPGKILGAIAGFGNLLYDAGKSLIEGLIHGVTDMAGKAVGAVKHIGKSIIGGARDVLKWFSPSKVFVEAGHSIGDGLIVGMGDKTQAAGASSGALAASAIQGATGSLGSGSVSNNSSTTMNSNQSHVSIGQVTLSTPEAAQEFFKQLNGDSVLVKNGLTPSQGMA